MHSFRNLFWVLSFFIVSAAAAQSPEVTMNPLAKKISQLEDRQTAQLFSPFLIAEYDETSNATIVENATYFSVDHTVVNNIIQNRFPFIELSVPWNDTAIILQLFPAEIFSPGFKVVTSQSGGAAIEYTPGVFYRGIIKGENASFAAINFFSDKISGVISAPGIGNTIISNLRSSPIHVIYNDMDLLIPNNLNCSTPEPEHFNYKKKETTEAKMMITPCVKVYIEADYEMFEEEGGATQTADYIVGLFNVSSTLFYNEGITDVISEIFVWVTDDPYPTSSSFDALDYFTTYRTDFNGDLAHLVTFDDENLGGVAWVDVLCSSYNYAYSNIYNYYYDFPTYSWTVMVFTHEMGHNLGSSHTHNCGWPGGAIDNCYTTEGGCDPGPEPVDGGTIMSYCHLTGYGINFSNGFGELPGTLIFDEVNDAACLGDCDLPPANDWPCAATVLDVNESCLFMESTNIGAINSVVPAVACDGESEGDVWFQLTVPAEGYVIIETDNGPLIDDMGMKVYFGTCTDLSGYPAGCVADGSAYAEFMPGFVVASAPPGTTIFLRLWEVNNDVFGDFSICAYTECTTSIIPAGLIATDTILCEGETATITFDGGVLGSLAHWTWYANECSGTPIGTTENLIVTPEITTTYFLQSIGACDTTECVSLTIEVASLPEIPVIDIGDCELTTELIDDAIYTWYLDGEIITDETDNTISITESGEYSVLISTYGNCSALSEVIFVECEQLGIEDVASAEIKIYPNPGNGQFNVSIFGYTGELTFKLYDIIGSLAGEKNVLISYQNNVVNMQFELTPGIYFLHVGNISSETTCVVLVE